MRIILAPTLGLAEATAVQQRPALTVEAEYGSTVIEGRVYTAAHHQKSGPYSELGGAVSPCVDRRIPRLPAGSVVLVSHLDLDTLGGVARAMGLWDVAPEAFWALAARIDTWGPHRLREAVAAVGTTEDRPAATEREVEVLHAYWAWARRLPLFPRDEVSDVTAEILEGLDVLRRAYGGDEDLLEAGREFRRAGEDLNTASFVSVTGGVILRRSAQFVNHLYATPAGVVHRAVVAKNDTTGAITVSLEKPIQGFSCADFARDLWGPEAGGHAGIAGSPRGQEMPWEEAVRAAAKLADALAAREAQ
jgi:hypothetical protein